MTIRTSPHASSRTAAPARARRPTPGRSIGMALLLGLAALNVRGTAQPTNLPSARLNVVMAGSLVQNANINDIKAAFKLWIEAVGRNRGFALITEADTYNRREDVDERIREKSVDLVIMTTLDYLESTSRESLDPVYSPARRKEAKFDDYVLLTRKDRQWTDLEGLRGKSIMIYKYGCDLGPLWMEVALGEGRFGRAADFFGPQSRVTKVSAAILPVFFNKSDACLVDRSGWETMRELNPQLVEQLQVLVHSPVLSESVICIRRGYEGPREDLLHGLADLHEEPSGKQILLVFKIDRLVPFQPEYLDSVRDLRTRLAKVKSVPAGAGGPRGPAVRQMKKRNRP